jgi:threonine/homoserine/homoserine lactone efflux protein
MIRLIGVLLILLGIVTILWGDKDLSIRGGKVLRLFSWPQGNARWAKWLVGAAFIYAGLKMIL